MSKLSKLDILKFASVSPKFRNYLTGTKKTAADNNTEFNEKPAVNEEEDVNGTKKPNDAKPAVPPQDGAVQPAEEAVPPVADGGSPEEIGARAAKAFLGAETMAAAASGDPIATDIIARTAGQVAGAVAEAASKMGASAAPADAAVPPGAVPPEGAPVEATAVPAAPGAQPAAVPAAVPASPEEAVADALVPGAAQDAVGEGKAPNTNVVPPAQNGAEPAKGFPPKKGEPPKKEKPVPANGEQYDAQTVAKLLQLAKAGQI